MIRRRSRVSTRLYRYYSSAFSVFFVKLKLLKTTHVSVKIQSADLGAISRHRIRPVLSLCCQDKAWEVPKRLSFSHLEPPRIQCPLASLTIYLFKIRPFQHQQQHHDRYFVQPSTIIRPKMSSARPAEVVAAVRRARPRLERSHRVYRDQIHEDRRECLPIICHPGKTHSDHRCIILGLTRAYGIAHLLFVILQRRVSGRERSRMPSSHQRPQRSQSNHRWGSRTV